MTMLSTSDVLDHHLNSFAKYDLAGILADYSSDAVLFTPAGPLTGPAAINPLFQALVSEFAKPGSSFTVQHRSIKYETAGRLFDAVRTAKSFFRQFRAVGPCSDLCPLSPQWRRVGNLNF